ncbi:unnamed protein product [Arabidopsis halleri]
MMKYICRRKNEISPETEAQKREAEAPSYRETNENDDEITIYKKRNEGHGCRKRPERKQTRLSRKGSNGSAYHQRPKPRQGPDMRLRRTKPPTNSKEIADLLYESRDNDAERKSCRNRKRPSPNVARKPTNLDLSGKQLSVTRNQRETAGQTRTDPLTTPARSAGGRRGQNERLRLTAARANQF